MENPIRRGRFTGGQMRAAGGIVVALWPGVAFAADGGAVTGGAAAAVVALLAAIAIAFRYRRQLAVACRQADALAARLTRADALLAARPDQYLCRDLATGADSASTGLAALVGCEGDCVGLDAVAAGLAGDGAEVLSRGLATLGGGGETFEAKVATTAGRSLRISARRVGGPGAPALAVLWFADVSATTEARARIEAERNGLRALLDLVPVPVWRRDGALHPVFVNRAYADAVAAESANGAPAEIAAGDGRALARRVRDQGTAASERRHIVIGGERRLVEIGEAPDPAGAGTAGYMLDLTAVETAEIELTRHIEGHEEVLHNLGTALAIYGPDRKLKFFNNAFLRTWELDEVWLRTEPDIGDVLEAMRERRKLPEFADFPAFKQEMQSRFTSLIEPLEELVHLPDETTFRMVVTPHPFGGLLFTWEDVTDALALERLYNTLIEVQRETLDNLYEGVAVIGGDGRLKLSNPAFGRMWRIPGEALRGGLRLNELVDRMRPFLADGGDWASRKEEIIELLTDRMARSGRLERSDGSVLEYASVPLPDGAVLLSYLDVSDSTRVERALRERNEALETADRLKSEFIANVSYELRTPLNTIIGFAEILTDQYFGSLNPRQIEYSRGILESSQRLLSLINDILDLASIEAGHMTLELETIDLYRMLSSVLALTRERARKKNLTIEFDCPSDIGTIVGDERRLKQALFNILSNSVKFTPENGTVRLLARRTADAVELAFLDTGVGIPREDHGRVFGKFERGTHPEARHGAGLGLSLVKSFIELHGGAVELELGGGGGHPPHLPAAGPGGRLSRPGPRRRVTAAGASPPAAPLCRLMSPHVASMSPEADRGRVATRWNRADVASSGRKNPARDAGRVRRFDIGMRSGKIKPPRAYGQGGPEARRHRPQRT